MTRNALRMIARLVDLSRAAIAAIAATAVCICLYCTRTSLAFAIVLFTKVFLHLEKCSDGEAASHPQVVVASFVYCIFPNHVEFSVSFA